MMHDWDDETLAAHIEANRRAREVQPSLVTEQADEVVEFWRIASHYRLIGTCVCRRCEGRWVGSLSRMGPVDPDGLVEDGYGSAVFQGSYRCVAADLRISFANGGQHFRPASGEHPSRKALASSKKFVPLDDQYLALLESPSANALPDFLPLWCAKHGRLMVEVASLRRELAAKRKKAGIFPV